MTKLMPWVGGKAQLMWAIQMLLPTHYKTLVDVFGGSGIITMNGGNRHEQEKIYPAAHRHR